MKSGKEFKNSEKLTATLFKISNAVNTTDNLDDLYKSIHNSLNHIIDATNFYIALYDRQNDIISFPYNVDVLDGAVRKNINHASKSNSSTSEVIQKGKPLFFRKEEMIARTRQKEFAVSSTPSELWLGVPLTAKGDVIGAIVIQSYDDPDIYDQKDMDLLISISDQVALAINRKLAEDAQKKSEKINKVLFAISNAVNTTLNLDDLFESIHKSLGKIMDLSNFYIALYDKKKDCVDFPYFVDEKDSKETIPVIQNVSDPETPSSTAWVIQSGMPLLFNKDYLIAHMKKIKKNVVGTPPSVWMGSPLKVKKEVIGVMVAQSYSDPNLYNKKDLEIFNSVSDQVALAIERKRAQDAETESKTINKVLFSISNAVNTTENLDELYKSIHESLGSVIDVTNFMIGIYDHEKDTISYPYYRDEIDDDYGDIHNVSKSGIIASEVISLAKPFLTTREDAIERAKNIGADIVGKVAEQWLGIPLIIKRKVIGVIVVQSYSNPELYSKKDVEILMAVSDQIAMAIDRKRSQEELGNSEKLTRTLFKISNAVNTTLNLDDLFESIHKILAEVIDVTNFAIGIYNSKKDIMSYPYYVDKTGDSYNEIQNVSSSGIIASEVINLAKPFFITGDKILERAKKIGSRITEAVPPEQWLGVPLKTNDEVIGVIVVQSYSDPELYSQKDADILTSISDQIAIAITRKQSEDAKKESEETNKVLFKISNAVNTTSDLNELYKSIHTFLGRVIDLTNFIIGLYNKNDTTLSFEYYIDQFDDLHGKSVILDDGSSIGGSIVKSGKPIFLKEKDLKEKAKHNIGTLPKIWMGVPLKIDDEVIGYMATQSYIDPYLFDHNDLEIFTAVSDQVAIAIDRKRSEEALAKSKKRIENISNQTEQFSLAAASMISTKNPKDVFNKISRAIVEFSNFKRVVITYLTDKPPYHEILAYDGLRAKNIEKYKKAVIKPDFFEGFLTKGGDIGHFSVFIQAIELKKAYNAKLTIKNNQNTTIISSDSWHPDDMLFVKMLDVSGNLIGFISVDDPISMKKPTDETVRPLEIFSSLVSQIIIYTKSQEELKIAKNAAEASAKSKSEFLANMSHEIRTPMNAIMGLTELTLKTDLDLRQKDYLKKIKSSSTSLLGIINDILDFSKIDAGKMNIEKIDFELNDVMDSLSDMFSTKTAEKGVEFVISISNDIPLNLIGDPLRLRQALINLTGNAVKFTKKGEIIVSVSPVECKGGYIKLKFAVQDSGIGIPKDRLGKLFASFVQADGSTTRKYGGTGLGLSISKQLIELMGGSIEVKSKVGKGTRFSFYITFKKKNTKTRDNKHFDTELKGMKVLVVDDNKAARDIMHETLSSFSFKVKAVNSGEKSIKELIKSNIEDTPYKLVILDLIMPEMDGIDTAKLIRSNPNITDVSIIMMTAFGREEVMHQAKNAGVNAFLMKPVKQSLLLDTIMDVFDKKPDNYIPEADEAKATANEFAQLNGLNVLLAEDNNINQLVASRILEEVGVSVTIASTGLAAVQFLEKNKFDAVLMDIQMPEMDGYCATGEIRNKLKLHDLPIIAMTAHAMAGDREKCINAGMNDYISKPIDPDILFSKLLKFGVVNKSKSPDPKKNKANIRQVKKAPPLNMPANLPDFLPGIDIKSGVSRFRGDIELYVKLLADFINDYKNSVEKINAMLKTMKFKDALDYLHAIKGIAGNLSVSRLYKASTELESFIEKNSKADTSLLNNYKKTFLEASGSFDKIHELFTNSRVKLKDNSDSEFKQEDISKKIKLLYIKILDNDLEAIDVFNIVKKMIQNKIEKDEILILDKAINNFDFDEAKIVLFKIADIFNITLKRM